MKRVLKQDEYLTLTIKNNRAVKRYYSQLKEKNYE